MEKYRSNTEKAVKLSPGMEEIPKEIVESVISVIQDLLKCVEEVVNQSQPHVKELHQSFSVLSELWGRWITVRKVFPQFSSFWKQAAKDGVSLDGKESSHSFSHSLFSLYLRLIERSFSDERISKDIILPYIRVVTEREKSFHLAKIVLQKPDSPIYKIFAHELVLALLIYPPPKVYKAFQLLKESPGQSPQDIQNIVTFLTDMYPKAYVHDPHGANEAVIRILFSVGRFEQGMNFLESLLKHEFYNHASTFVDFLSHFYSEVLSSIQSVESEVERKKRVAWVLSQLEKLYPRISSDQSAAESLDKIYQSFEELSYLNEYKSLAESSKERGQNAKKVKLLFCHNCGNEGADKRCSMCKLVNYCSKDCQAEDWKKEHKSKCVAVE
eukprot:TRINITY_DN2703_c0_g1_i1.p1 TRINITY_DN2703_c0_g1~~TRINITY_DN2703_c0_g1_i1.p1  ORF type:complete len:436 (+),score=157.96 TRINITY_DN2703_c0_g1_i1:159-1310(+)